MYKDEAQRYSYTLKQDRSRENCTISHKTNIQVHNLVEQPIKVSFLFQF